MAYIGVQPTAGQYRKLDNISASFNGSTTSFTTSVGGTNVTAGTAQQLIVSLGGVIQQPDTDYTVSTNTITFTTAPTSGLDFFAILMGDALNTVTPSDGSVTTSKLAGSLSVGLADGTVSAPSLFFTGDTNCGLYSPSDDQLAVTTNGVERVEWGTSEVVFNDGGTNYDFRVEGDTNANLLFVDASADAVGIGTSSPSSLLHVEGTSGNAKIRLGTGGDHTLIGPDSSGHTIINAATVGGNMQLQLAGTTKVTLNSTGLGIGTTSVSQPFVVSNGGAAGLEVDPNGANSGPTIQGYNRNTSAFVPVTMLGSHLAYRTGSSPTEVGRWDSSGRLLVGTSSTSGVAMLQVQGYVGDTNGLGLLALRTGSSSPANGASLGRIDFNDSTDSRGASIGVDRDGGTWSASSKPSRLVFSTTADGASSPTERLRIANNGQLSAVVPGNSTLYPGFMARAWVSFNGTGTVAIIGSGNVSSITDNGVGIYAVNFTTALPDGNYAVATGFKRIATSSEFVNVGFSNSTTSFNVEFFAGGGNVDTSNMQLVIFR